jgi:hypothetical protein
MTAVGTPEERPAAFSPSDRAIVQMKALTINFLHNIERKPGRPRRRSTTYFNADVDLNS